MLMSQPAVNMQQHQTLPIMAVVIMTMMMNSNNVDGNDCVGCAIRFHFFFLFFCFSFYFYFSKANTFWCQSIQRKKKKKKTKIYTSMIIMALRGNRKYHQQQTPKVYGQNIKKKWRKTLGQICSNANPNTNTCHSYIEKKKEKRVKN